MNILKSTFILLIISLTCNRVFSQDIAALNKVTIDDYRLMWLQQQAAVKQNLTAVLKADSNFRKYNQLSQDNELAFASRDRSKPYENPKPYPKTKEERIARYQQQGISNPELYYNNQMQANQQLKAVVIKYPLFTRLDIASRMAIIKDATITPPDFYQKLAKAVSPKSYVIK